MSTEPTKIPESAEIDALEERLVVENLEVVERVVWGILRMERRLKVLREWYEDTRDKRKRKVEYLKRLVEAYAVPWRLKTGESVLPIETGKVRVTKGRVVDLSNEAEVEQWVLEARAAEEKVIAAGLEIKGGRVPVKITISPDWSALREWVKWGPDGTATDPRTGEIIPGLKRGQAEPWHVSIKERDAEKAVDLEHLEALPEVEPITCDVCRGEGRVKFIHGTVVSDVPVEENVECGTCRGTGVLGIRDVEEDMGSERRSA